MTTPEIEIKLLQTLAKMDVPSWQSLRDPRFPFTDFNFLRSLEKTDCLGDRTGWSPLYLVAYQGAELLGALILFAKNNSYGEYIFDFNWAEAHEASGVPYYPKLLSAIPFTPATGSKILLKRELPSDVKNQVTIALLQRVQTLVQESGATSAHFLFIPEEERQIFVANGFFIRNSFQYHWKNNGYAAFQDFLNDLRSKRKREVVRERKQVHEQGVTIQRLTGDELTPRHAQLMFDFYHSTIDKRHGFDYLTPEFFTQVFATMKEQILLVLAFKDGQEVAAALNFIGGHALYGRYWGCAADYRALHFEVCYYQGIEFCIEKGFELFEAGAQGEHKFQRGFLPAYTYSAHSIEHPGLDRAIQDFVRRERQQLEILFQQYAEQTPFSREK